MLGLQCSTVCSRDVDVDADRQKKIWISKRMEKISCLDNVTNEKVLRRVNEDRQILNSIWQTKHRWIGHVLRHDGLLHEIMKGRHAGKPTRGRRRIQMLHDLANDGGFAALNGQLRTERYGDRQKGCQKPALQQKTTTTGTDDDEALATLRMQQIISVCHAISFRFRHARWRIVI